jgi:gliding motility-associated-like protein
VTFAQLGAHAVAVTATENGCTGTFQDSIRVFPLPTVAFEPDTGGCRPFLVPFTNSASAWTPLRFLWQFGDGASSTDSLPVHVYTQPGLHDVTLTVSTDSGCVASISLTKAAAVDVWPQPVARFTAAPLITSLLDPEVDFMDHSTDAVQWDFEVEGLHYDHAPFTHRFDDAGPFDVHLTVMSEQGCTDTTTVQVFVGDHLFFAPNSFTPNGDDINETWRPEVRGARLYRLEVFDRWGRQVFGTTDPEEAWDGKNAVTGPYAYKAWLSEWGPLEKEYRGTVTLIR